MNKGVFIVGTDTGVGKTIVAAGLSMVMREEGMHVGVMKPIASGCRMVGSSLISDDAVFLMEAAQGQFPGLTNPVRLKEPLAPAIAAEIEEAPVDIHKVLFAYRELKAHYEYLIIEGVGGALVPLTPQYLVVDLIRAMEVPVIVVGRIGLGTINHTLLTLEALQSRGIPVMGVILNGLNPQTSSLAELTNPRAVEKFGRTRLLGVLPDVKGLSVEECVYGDLAEVFKKTISLDALWASIKK